MPLAAHVLIQFREGTTGFRFFKKFSDGQLRSMRPSVRGAGRAVRNEPLRRGR
jgi:hypothetical protein